MRISVPKLTPSSKKKVFCPYCIFMERYVPMVYDAKLEMWHCNMCNETLQKRQDPVETGSLVAGNEEAYSKPYIKTVEVKKRTEPKILDMYNNPMDAWQTDENI